MAGTIVRREKDQEIPEAFLDKVFAELKPNSYVYLVSMDDEVLYESRFDQGLNKLNIMSLLKGHDEEIMLLLEHHETEPAEENMQPFDLCTQTIEREGGKKEEQIFFAGVVEGDFSNFHRDKSTRPDEYFMIENVVHPRIDQLVELCEGDVDKIVEQLKKPIIFNEFTGTPKSQGAIGIACATGDFILFGKEGQVSSFPWGQVSNTFGYTTAKPAEPPKEESMAERMKSKIKSKIKPKADEDSLKRETTTTVPAIVQKAITETKQVKAIVPGAWKAWNNREKKRWQETSFGFIKAGWRQWKVGQEIIADVALGQRPVVVPPENKAMGKIADVVEFKKDTQPHVVKPETVLPVTDVKPSDMGVSSVPELKAMRAKLMDMDEIKALIAAGASPIMSMSDLEKLKVKLPSFSDLTGLDTIVGYQLSGPILDDLYYHGGITGWNVLKSLIKHMQIACLTKVWEHVQAVQQQEKEDLETRAPVTRSKIIKRA